MTINVEDFSRFITFNLNCTMIIYISNNERPIHQDHNLSENQKIHGVINVDLYQISYEKGTYHGML